MLDMFLKVAYAASEKERQQKELDALLRQLPAEDLHKIAQTGVVPLTKHADSETAWLDQFQGTPFMDQAINLEQERLQVDAQRQQTARQRMAQSAQVESAEDQIRLRKRLLELQKAKAEALPTALPAEQAEEVPAGVDRAGLPVKAASMLPAAEHTGRLLARLDMAKVANLGSALKTVALRNPGMVVGGALGAAHGLLKNDGGVGDALVEGVGGAAAGHAIGGVTRHLGNGKSIEDALSRYKKDATRDWGSVVGNAPKAPAPTTVQRQSKSRQLALPFEQ